MSEATFEHLLCIGILLGRLGDVASTWLATPRLRLETNLLVRRLRWGFALATLLMCLVAYWSTALGVVVLVVSWLVTAENLRRAWLPRALGEERTLEIYTEALRRSSRGRVLAFVWSSASITMGVGLLTMYMSRDWGQWIGAGLFVFGFAVGLHHTLFALKMFRAVVRESATTA